MKRLMIGIATATLLSTASFATQADERGGRNGYSRGPAHSPASSHAQRTAPRHYQQSSGHYTLPRHYGHPRSHGNHAHSGWGSRYGASRHWGYNQRAYRRWH